MCRCLFLLLVSSSFSLSEIVANDREQHIVRPAIKIDKDDVKSDLTQEKLLPIPRQPKKEEADYQDETGGHEQVLRKKTGSIGESEERPIPRLSIDPPRKPFDPNFGQEDKKDELELPQIPIIIVDQGAKPDTSYTPPWQVSVSVDISHVILIALSALMLFWIVNKAFNYYYRPRPSIVTPVIGDENIVHKMPLP